MTVFWIVAIGAVFALWAIAAFRALSHLMRAALARASARGASWPGVDDQLRTLAGFVTEPRFREDRRRLGTLTPLLFALIALQFALR